MLCAVVTRYTHASQTVKIFSHTASPLMLCVVSGQCSIQAQAYGANHNDDTRYGYLKLNGVAVWQASWQGEHTNERGANIFVVDTSTCTLQESRRFDTYDDNGAAARLRDYLRSLRDGTVLVGVSADEASKELDAAEATLSALGADVSDVGWRGAWAFVAVIGDPSQTVLDKELTEAAANARQPLVNVSFAGAHSTIYCTRSSAQLTFRSLANDILSVDFFVGWLIGEQHSDATTVCFLNIEPSQSLVTLLSGTW